MIAIRGLAALVPTNCVLGDIRGDKDALWLTLWPDWTATVTSHEMQLRTFYDVEGFTREDQEPYSSELLPSDPEERMAHIRLVNERMGRPQADQTTLTPKALEQSRRILRRWTGTDDPADHLELLLEIGRRLGNAPEDTDELRGRAHELGRRISRMPDNQGWYLLYQQREELDGLTLKQWLDSGHPIERAEQVVASAERRSGSTAPVPPLLRPEHGNEAGEPCAGCMHLNNSPTAWWCGKAGCTCDRTAHANQADCREVDAADEDSV
ncbi:MAG: hypothetical protein JJU29_07440 [Verrucomicrobia bacterium]|nr:hypothetical protein [Verrucomicrobiota bacterium]